LGSCGILRSDFADENGLIINYRDKCVKYKREGRIGSIGFSKYREIDATRVEKEDGNPHVNDSQEGRFQLSSIDRLFIHRRL
jgi:dUTPase